MNDKTNETQAAESSQEATQQESSTSEATLEDLYGEFPSQETPPSQSTQQETQTDVQPRPSIPDPVSEPEAFRTHVGNELAAAQASVQKVQQQLTQREQELNAQAEERDFRNIAEDIAKEAELDADLAEASLLHKFVKDKGFQNVWRNRDKNPAAFSKVKTHLANEMKGRFSVKVDHQIAENQRAAEEATTGASGTKSEEKSQEDKLMTMDGAAFDREMRKLKEA